ncbi:MAG: hypothetical protein PHG97_02345 [Candidatus Margulisbacteria bacterium]|nr:hypothetical protein [Candidatus Margulisiibacteriota bacterium]
MALYATLGDTGGKNFRAQAGQSRGQNITGAQQDIRTGMGQLAGAIGSHFAPKPGEEPKLVLKKADDQNSSKPMSGAPGTSQAPANGVAPAVVVPPPIPETDPLDYLPPTTEGKNANAVV